MKSKLKFLIILILTLIIFTPNKINAEGITNYLINSTIQSNGDLNVEEYFYLDGYFNGFERYIDYQNDLLPDFNSESLSYGGSKLHNGDNIIIEKVASLDIDQNYSFNKIPTNLFKETKISQEPGTTGLYNITNNTNGIKLRIYLPSDENKAFYIKYKITNMAILHNDVGELGWNIVGRNLTENISSLKAYINIPNNNTELKAWAHGPLNGKVNILSNQKIEVSIDNLNSNTAIDVRTTFDRNVINNSKKQTNTNALDKILVYEQEQADIANKERDRINNEIKNNALNAITKLEQETTRYNYTNAITLTNLIGDENIKTEYLNRIKLQYDNVEIYEVKNTEQMIDLAIKLKDYKYYDLAKKSLSNVYEEKNINYLNKKLEQAKYIILIKENNVEIILTLISLSTVLISYLIYKTKYIHLSTYNNEIKYLRDFPSDLHPSSVGFLFDKKATPNQITANLLHLIDKKVIKYEKVEQNNYSFSIIKENNIDLSEIDQAFISLFFDKKITITSKQFIKKSSSNNLKEKYIFYKGRLKKNLIDKNLIIDDKDAEPKRLNIDIFIILSIISITNYKCMYRTMPLLLLYLLIKNGFKKSTISIFFFIFSIIANIYLLKYSFKTNLILHYSIIFCIINIIFNLLLMKKSIIDLIKRTKEGEEEFNKWYKFKNFLKDFSLFKEKELPEISLWQKYLVYATSLGCAEKLSKIMSNKISQLNQSDDTYSLFTNIDDFILLNSMNNMINVNNYLRNTNPTYKIISPMATFASSRSGSDSSWSSSSDYSSGSGSGGGFSGGSSSGGSFGGGGGGGRF